MMSYFEQYFINVFKTVFKINQDLQLNHCHTCRMDSEIKDLVDDSGMVTFTDIACQFDFHVNKGFYHDFPKVRSLPNCLFQRKTLYEILQRRTRNMTQYTTCLGKF